MTRADQYFSEASQYWDLERLYDDLASANGGKSITPTQKKFLRGVLRYKQPKEIAEICHCGVDWVKQSLYPIYRLIEIMLDLDEGGCKIYAKVCPILKDYQLTNSPNHSSIDLHRNQLTDSNWTGQEFNQLAEMSEDKQIWQSLDDVLAYIESFNYYCQQEQFLEAFYIIFDGDDYSNCVYKFLSYSGYIREIICLYEKLIRLWQPRKHEKWEFGIAITCLADAHHRLGEYKTAIDYHKRALEISLEISDLRGEAGSLINLGYVYYSLKDYLNALKYNRCGLELARVVGNREFEGNALNNFGLIFQAKKKYDLAIDYHYHALEVRRELGDQHGEAGSLINIGDNYRYLDQNEWALKFLEKGVKVAQQSGHREFEANGLFNLGLALEDLGHESEALLMKEKAINIFRDMGLDR